jgi:lipopolysaccharide/colanic/teichoic acid biosynthesis glycosyltransferase
MSKRKDGFYVCVVKRVLDLIFSMIGLIVMFIPMLMIALLVRIKLGSPVLFIQERPGKNMKLFKIYKFRTMIYERDESGKLIADHMRLTKFGKFLRSTSLDELPELINVFKGEMSFVGPRPLLVQFLKFYYKSEELVRYDVFPGITGLAQINNRNDLDYRSKFILDKQYVEEVTFLRDIKIVFMTFLVLVKRCGVNLAEEEFVMGELGDYLLRANEINIDEYNSIQLDKERKAHGEETVKKI